MLKQPKIGKTGVARLRKLATLLDKLQDNLNAGKTGPLTKTIDTFDLSVYVCGSAACALGVASLHPQFQNEGLIPKYQGPDLLDLLRRDSYIPAYRRHRGINAGSKFFEISDLQASYLFLESSYPESHRAPRYVADRIRKFIARDGNIVSPVFENQNCA
jgi:hypothetical protein